MALDWKYATVCFLRREGKTLFIDYTNYQHPIHEGFYAPPWGKIEDDEDPIQTTIRELEEETGIILKSVVYRGLIKFDNEERKIKGKPFKHNFEVHIYDCYDFDDSNARATEGHLAWIDDMSVLSLPLHESDKELWRWLTQYKEVYGTIKENEEILESAVIDKFVPLGQS